MRPLAALLGIAMGSAVSMFVGLSLTAVVFMLLPEYSERLGGEYRPLAIAIGWSLALLLATVAAFVGEIRETRWRRLAQLSAVLVVAGMALVYWPQGE
ncbi:MAG: hypothetical protein RL026_419 [Pseudomonadota bacterium]|jgi:hypothetical protein